MRSGPVICRTHGGLNAFNTQIASIHGQLQTPTGVLPFFLVRRSSGSSFDVGAVEDYESFFQGVPTDDVHLSPHPKSLTLTISSSESSASWTRPALLTRGGLSGTYSRIYGFCIRSSLSGCVFSVGETLKFQPGVRAHSVALVAVLTGHPGSPTRSLIGTVTSASAEDVAARPQVVGWEKNAAGKMGARMADLAPMMDPVR